MRKSSSSIVGLMFLIALAAPSEAALLTYRMTLVNESPLTEAGHVLGVFSFDDSLMPDPGTHFLSSSNILTDLSMLFGGEIYNTDNTDSAGMRFDEEDRPELTAFGTDCDPPFCNLEVGTVGWIVSIAFSDGIVDVGLFEYTNPGIAGSVFVPIELTRVPLPPAVLLFASGVLSLWGARRNRRMICL